jgi:predicted MPP superfamily phosphohydrolase
MTVAVDRKYDTNRNLTRCIICRQWGAGAVTLLQKEYFMSEQNRNAECPATESRPDTSRPPLMKRAGALAERRLKRERFLRGLDIDKDETALFGFVLKVIVYSIRFVLLLLRLYHRGIRNARELRLVHHDISVPGLPDALEGFRILHLSDFHFPKRFPEFAASIGNLLKGVEVDLCVLTGDYRYGYFGPAEHVAPHLLTALQDVKTQYGVYAVLGNHDRFHVGELLENAGIPVLFNEGEALCHNGYPIWICGIDEPHFYGCDDMDAALQGRPENAFTIMLVHSPERVRAAAKKGVSLYLAGHTHGGQIRLPLVGAVVSNARCSRSQIWGAWQYKNMAGHTTSGIGATDVPVRYNCPPEAAVLTLRRSGTEHKLA